MTTTMPRSAIHTSQYPVVDSQLKSLKLVTRRLKSVAQIQETESLILQRLFYKNNNQHRSALFWRNISEIRRYSRRLVSQNILEDLQSFRAIFYGSPSASAESVGVPSDKSMRGSWTCLPAASYFMNISVRLDRTCKLAEKMSEVCSRAYMSFHRSLQSGAFLILLLTFVAISSRLEAISSEVKEICKLAASCMSTLLVVHEKSENVVPTANAAICDDVGIEILDVDEPAIDKETSSQKSGLTVIHNPAATMIVKRKRPQEQGDIDTQTRPQKKKRKEKRNEIDDIFGF